MNQPDVAPEVMSSELPAGAYLLDVREDDEWMAGPGVHLNAPRLGG